MVDYGHCSTLVPLGFRRTLEPLSKKENITIYNVEAKIKKKCERDLRRNGNVSHASNACVNCTTLSHCLKAKRPSKVVKVKSACRKRNLAFRLICYADCWSRRLSGRFVRTRPVIFLFSKNNSTFYYDIYFSYSLHLIANDHFPK